MKKFIAEFIPENLHIYYQMRKAKRHWISKNIIFIHIPKNAGVSIAHTIYASPMGHWTFKDLIKHHPSLVSKIPTFSVVRNPFERLHSAYTFACQGYGLGVQNGPAVKNHKQYKRPEFSTYERFICEWIANAALPKTDFIFRTQTSFVTDENNKTRTDHIFKLEQIPIIERFLSESLKRDINLPRLNYTSRHTNYKMTSEMEAVIRDIYHEDFSNFYEDL